MKKVLTLAFCIQEDQILLAMKKRGFGNGRWNGFGGKVEPGESIEEAAKREVFEECRVEVSTLEKRAIHTFTFEKSKDILEVHTFWVDDWQGEPQETEEMKPKRFALKDIPYAGMWPDDELWLPQFLAGKYMKTEFFFGENDSVLEYDITTSDTANILYEG